MAEEIVWKGNEDLRPLLVPLDQITLLPGNPRRGHVESVMTSLRRFGQRSTISLNQDEVPDGEGRYGTSLAGNTRVKAALELGWTHIAASWSQDEDPREAAGFAAADNRTHDLGEYDPVAMGEWVENEIGLDDVGEEILADAGYDALDIEDVLAQASEALIPEEDDDGNFTGGGGGGNPVIQTNIVFDDEEQQAVWFKFVRWLKATYPDEETVAARLIEFLSNALPEDDD